MIVEDEFVILQQLEVLLVELGYEVCAKALSGEKAVQEAEEKIPDLILMDINLIGEIDGVEAARQIQTRYDIPIIYVTAFDNPELLARAKVTEPYGYILKPFEPRELNIAIDISLYKHQVKKEKAELQARLHQAQKMEAIGTLAGGIAHVFNNILWAIMGFTELTLNKLIEGSQERKYLERVLQASEKAKNIISQFLAFSRQSEADRQTVQLGLIIEESIQSLRESLPPNIQIKINIRSATDLILANPQRIEEMLRHLYSNALHAIGEKDGVLEITLEDIYLNDQQSTLGQGLTPGPYFKLTIADTGPGMEQSVLDQIFEPFFSTKEVGTGMGLGLSVVYGIVNSHGGNISIASTPGNGAKFTILLPKKNNLPQNW
jgi:signal transduction histidine kinase